MTKIGRRCYVSGVVQGVFYRRNTKAQALEHGLTGWVKNLPNGRVEVLMFGAEENIMAMLEWLAVGPERAVVTNLEVLEAKLESHEGFKII